MKLKPVIARLVTYWPDSHDSFVKFISTNGYRLDRGSAYSLANYISGTSAPAMPLDLKCVPANIDSLFITCSTGPSCNLPNPSSADLGRSYGSWLWWRTQRCSRGRWKKCRGDSACRRHRSGRVRFSPGISVGRMPIDGNGEHRPKTGGGSVADDF